MRPENLFRAMNEIDPKTIEASERYKEKSNLVMLRHFVPLAACACFAIIILAAVPGIINNKQANDTAVMMESATAAPEEMTEEYSAEESFDMAAEDVMEEKQAEEMEGEPVEGIASFEEAASPEEEMIGNDADKAEPLIDVAYLTMSIDETVLDIEWEDNESVKAIMDSTQYGPAVMQMYRKEGVEQYTMLETDALIPSDDQECTVTPGDIVLFDSECIAIVYVKHTGNYTKLGKIVGLSEEELVKLLSDNDVTLTISAEE